MRKLMTNIEFLFLLGLLAVGAAHANDEAAIGDDYIPSLNFPKFSLHGDYVFLRHFHGFDDSSFRFALDRKWGAGMSFEAGLLNNFNAGGMFSATIPNLGKHEPFNMRFMLFAKPFIPFGDRFSIFARAGGGLSWTFYGDIRNEVAQAHKDSLEEFERVYRGQVYKENAYGGVALLTAGLEFFPFARIGVALEFGIRTSILRKPIDHWFYEPEKRIDGAPSGFNYMIYEFPLSLTIHGII